MSADWNDSTPIYRQLKERVVGMMLDGVLKAGDALPSMTATVPASSTAPTTTSSTSIAPSTSTAPPAPPAASDPSTRERLAVLGDDDRPSPIGPYRREGGTVSRAVRISNSSTLRLSSRRRSISRSPSRSGCTAGRKPALA